MTQYPNQPDAGTANAGEQHGQPKNTLGLVGFIVSLASVITCGFLAPVGLLLSFVALFKSPRGFAIAGTIIGLILSLIPVSVIFSMIFAASMVRQGVWVTEAYRVTPAFYSANGRLPTEQEFHQELTRSIAQWPGYFSRDFNAAAYRYEPLTDTTARLTLSGWDGRFDTADDISEVIDVAQLARPSGGSAPSP